MIKARCRNKALYKAIVIAVYSGARLNEVINLQFKNIENDCIQIINTETFKTKNKKIREVPLSPFIRDMLKEDAALQLPDNYLLGHRYDKSYITRLFHRLMVRLGIYGLTFHNLRHTFLSRLADAGTPIRIIQEIAGHSSVEMTEKYLHVNRQQKTEAVRKLIY